MQSLPKKFAPFRRLVRPASPVDDGEGSLDLSIKSKSLGPRPVAASARLKSKFLDAGTAPPRKRLRLLPAKTSPFNQRRRGDEPMVEEERDVRKEPEETPSSAVREGAAVPSSAVREEPEEAVREEAAVPSAVREAVPCSPVVAKDVDDDEDRRRRRKEKKKKKKEKKEKRRQEEEDSVARAPVSESPAEERIGAHHGEIRDCCLIEEPLPPIEEPILAPKEEPCVIAKDEAPPQATLESDREAPVEEAPLEHSLLRVDDDAQNERNHNVPRSDNSKAAKTSSENFASPSKDIAPKTREMPIDLTSPQGALPIDLTSPGSLPSPAAPEAPSAPVDRLQLLPSTDGRHQKGHKEEEARASCGEEEAVASCREPTVACAACTFLNSTKTSYCAICGSRLRRPRAAGAARKKTRR